MKDQNEKKNRLLPFEEAAAAIVMWGTMPTVTKLLMNQMDPMLALMFTSLFASLILFFYNVATGRFKKAGRIPGKVLLRMTLIGSLGVFFYNLFYFTGTVTLSAQTAYIINDLWPALIIVFSCLILKEKMTLGKGLAILMSFIGIVVVTTGGHFRDTGNLDPAGVLFCLSAAVSYGLYSVLNKRESYDKGIAVFIAYATATAAALIGVLLGGKLRPLDGVELFGTAFSGIVCNGLPYLLWAMALEGGSVAVIANFAYLTPVISLVITHFVLGESVTLWSLFGTVLIVSGIFVQFLADRK